jgi:phosphatidate cytidylyltransferase
MLKYRLFFGTLMTVSFIGIVVVDGWLDGSITTSAIDNKPLQGTLLAVFITLLVIPAQLEFSRFATTKGLNVFTPVLIPASIVLATIRYWQQFILIPLGLSVTIVLVLALSALLLYQYLRHGVDGVMANCGVNCLSLIYIGILSSFALGIRLDFGLWPFLLTILVVKCADIGAYAIGSLFGKHKFCPTISPGKTWEGMLAAITFGAAVAMAFVAISDIMSLWLGAMFGICFAVIGQAGDLAESMIKRDARQKDSASNVPGFGGLLDIIDSPLLALPYAYLFFWIFLL